MCKFNFLILIALCLSVCYARECVNIYQQTNEDFTIKVEGLIDKYFYADNGELHLGGSFSSLVIQKDAGMYEVKGSYNLIATATVDHPHLCTQIFRDQQKSREVIYQFTKNRDPSRYGQQYTLEEVTNEIYSLNMESCKILDRAIATKQSDYVIQTLYQLDNLTAYPTQQS